MLPPRDEACQVCSYPRWNVVLSKFFPLYNPIALLFIIIRVIVGKVTRLTDISICTTDAAPIHLTSTHGTLFINGFQFICCQEATAHIGEIDLLIWKEGTIQQCGLSKG